MKKKILCNIDLLEVGFSEPTLYGDDKTWTVGSDWSMMTS